MILGHLPSFANMLRLNVYHRKVFYGIDPAAFESAAGVWRRLTRDYGYERSFKMASCVDVQGNPIPWYTYPAIEFLDKLSYAGKDVWEYGAGQSTLWWGRRAKSVCSIEHDPVWYDRMRPMLPDNCGMDLVTAAEPERYIRSIRDRGQFDVIVIDGIVAELARCKCCMEAARSLRPGGMIILDNSDRLPRACAWLAFAGFTQIDFAGFTPLSEWPTCTSVFFRGNLGFERIAKALSVLGGATEAWEAAAAALEDVSVAEDARGLGGKSG